MGWSIMPEVGGEFVCADGCDHSDCAYWRKTIGRPCAICAQPIDGGEKYYGADNGMEHALCVWEREEAR